MAKRQAVALEAPADHKVDVGRSGAVRRFVKAELDRRASAQRLTPAQRRIAYCMVEHSDQLGFLSSIELAKLAGVSQPSITRFAVALGYEGYLEMRRALRPAYREEDPAASSETNDYQAAALAEARNLTQLAEQLGDKALLDRLGMALGRSHPLTVLGLRSSAGLATHFSYVASKVHSDVRLIANGGSLLEDLLEQSRAAGGDVLLVFMMPLHPRETLRAIEFARQLGMRVVLVTDPTFANDGTADFVLSARINTQLVFDSHASASLLLAVLLDAMCKNMEDGGQARLEQTDRSSKRRRVFQV